MDQAWGKEREREMRHKNRVRYYFLPNVRGNTGTWKVDFQLKNTYDFT